MVSVQGVHLFLLQYYRYGGSIFSSLELVE